jgi:hypothetical protein
MKRSGRVGSALLIFSLSVPVCLLPAALPAQQNIGSVTTVKNKVQVVHPGQGRAVSVRPGDGVLLMDAYETMAAARAKLLLDDDSLLTLGEKTRLEITENVYDPSKDRRSAAMKLLSGRVRVLVGKTFTGTGSKFEIHTPTAVAAARGTYYIVWMFQKDGQTVTGVATLEGLVGVGNIDPGAPGTVVLGPNQYTVVAPGLPPSGAASIPPSLLAELLASTEAKDEPAEFSPPDLVRLNLDLLTGVTLDLDLLTGIETLRDTAGFKPSGPPAIPPILQQPPLRGSTRTLVDIQFLK